MWSLVRANRKTGRKTAIFRAHHVLHHRRHMKLEKRWPYSWHNIIFCHIRKSGIVIFLTFLLWWKMQCTPEKDDFGPHFHAHSCGSEWPLSLQPAYAIKLISEPTHFDLENWGSIFRQNVSACSTTWYHNTEDNLKRNLRDNPKIYVSVLIMLLLSNIGSHIFWQKHPFSFLLVIPYSSLILERCCTCMSHHPAMALSSCVS
jgi:hypothetical protein